MEIIDNPELDGISLDWFPKLGKPPGGKIDCKFDPKNWSNVIGEVCDRYEPFSEANRDCRNCEHGEGCY